MTRYNLINTNIHFDVATLSTGYDKENQLFANVVEGRTFTISKAENGYYEIAEVGSDFKKCIPAEATDYVGDDAWGYFERQTSQGRVTGLAIKVLTCDYRYLVFVPVGVPLQIKPHLAVLPTAK